MLKILLFLMFGMVAAPLFSQSETIPAASGEYGAAPVLTKPESSWIPTLRFAKAQPWSGDAMPQAAPGTRVSALVRHLKHPRWLYVLPNGDILVAESDAPPKPQDAKGLRGVIQRWAMRRAGSGVEKSADQITLIRDRDGDGAHVEQHVFLSGLHSPIGMALVGATLYVANTDAVVAFPYEPGATEIQAAGRKIVDLPAGPINHHWTKTLVASADGHKLYVGVGSNSNAGENGIDAEAGRNAVWEIDLPSGEHRVFANGMRNPVGLAWQPDTGALWVSVNERDELGDHLPPDYMTAVHDGAFYGFPYSYYGGHVDARMKPQDPAMVQKAIAPDYALGAHTASLGLCWSAGSSLPPFQNGMFVGQHGSWNRRTYSGYKVVFVPFKAGVPAGMPVDVLSHFLDSRNIANGRPVGLAIDKYGWLLVADDVGNTVWRVSAAGKIQVVRPPD